MAATARRRADTGGSRGEPPSGVGAGRSAQVVDLAARRIERAIVTALAQRSRYRYVQPRLEREGMGWKVVSPNCSRSVDAQGGDIDIAWLVPCNEGDWLLHARDHDAGCWRLLRRESSLEPLLEHLCADPAREFWQ